MSTFAERLGEKMKEKGLTNEKVGFECSCSGWTVSQWRNGHAKPSQERLEILAELLECDVEYLIYGKGEETPANETKNDVRRNGSGYFDPTAYKAIIKAEGGGNTKMNNEMKNGEIWECEFGGATGLALILKVQEGFCNVLMLKDEKRETSVAVVAQGMKYTDPALLSYKMNKAFIRYVRTMKDAEFEKIRRKVKESLGFGNAEENSLKTTADSLLDCQLREENERLKMELEDTKRKAESLKCENQILEIQKETMSAAVEQSDGIRIEMAKIQAERDLFKQFYEQMFERVIAK